MHHQNDFEEGNYNALDLRISMRYADDYLNTQDSREGFNAEEGIDALLIGSGYLSSVSEERYNIKDIDLYVPDREQFEGLENIPNVRYSTESEDVLHMEPQSGWHGEMYIEFFNSLDGALDLEYGELVDRALTFEVEHPRDTFFEGEVLDVKLPRPGAFAASKNLDGSNIEKYREQLKKVDEIFGTEISDELLN